jgi:OmcA/MtrC family decaheme c-type cytochrome
MPGQPTTVTEFSSYNNGGNGVSVVANTGTNDGTNKYTATTPAIPADDPATMVAAGTARIFSYGAVVEPKLDPVSRDPAVPADTVNVAVQHAFKEFAISGSLTPRRTVVANAKCNSCHSTLGTGSASNTLENAFHGGARNLVEACVICHDPNRVSSTVMADGSSFNESYQFKRMIHGLHGGTKRTYPFTHGNVRVDSYDKKCVSTTDMVSLCTDSNGLPISDPASGVENFTAEVAYPGILQDCNACHVNDSWKQDRGVLGAGVNKGTVTNRAFDDLVISPKAATCTACHDSIGVKTHVVNQGGATFGTMTQAQFLQGFVFEVCEGCHEVGGIRPVDKVHGLK